MAHAEQSPSSSATWLGCMGSLALSRGQVDKGSAHAAEGTAAHEMAERILRGEDGAKLVGKKAENGVPFTAEMLRDLGKYITAVQDIVASTDGVLHVEQRLNIEGVTGEVGAHGTADAVVVAGDELIVVDLKFGRGVVVEAENNTQLMIYALAALEKFDTPDPRDGLTVMSLEDLEDLL